MSDTIQKRLSALTPAQAAMWLDAQSVMKRTQQIEAVDRLGLGLLAISLPGLLFSVAVAVADSLAPLFRSQPIVELPVDPLVVVPLFVVAAAAGVAALTWAHRAHERNGS